MTNDAASADPHRAGGPLADLDPALLGDLTQLRTEFTRFMLQYRFGVDEVITKIGILREEFRLLHDYNPIEHVGSRLKSPESIIAKVARKGSDPSFEAIRESITDIAGVRLTCSFTSDVYRLFDMLTSQSDLTVIEVKDYIAHPKPNGYRSLHALVKVPVFLSDGAVQVTVELQFRTIAMDFWASLEHKIFYKYRREVPREVVDHLTEAAETANRLDSLMEDLHQRVHAGGIGVPGPDDHLVPTDAVLERFHAIRAHREHG
ncbi:GTP pyrophosphokinase family protein [Nocardiopsis mangrovi]|uniref:GTP pyrophosphokinase family protein n=1 Tax=Nocardiopsis mangrovi TaxID=1179818 RepID=A0ABV9DRU2_9ACTN